jgi:hypothetical protein
MRRPLQFRKEDQSGLHDVATGRAVLDGALASLGFCGASLGCRHAAASGFLGHGIFSGWLLTFCFEPMMPVAKGT